MHCALQTEELHDPIGLEARKPNSPGHCGGGSETDVLIFVEGLT
jgi:hypothetical protein